MARCLLDDFRIAVLRNEDPCAEHAALAGMGQADDGGGAGGTVSGVRQENLRGLSTKLQLHALEARGGLHRDLGPEGEEPVNI